MTTTALAEEDRIRERLMTAREDVRRRRDTVMLEAGRLLRAWRETRGVQQQDLAAVACVSPTVVRRIEKGDYESPPPQSLIAALARQHGPDRELHELAQAYQRLQAEQKQIDKLLTRKTLPDTVGLLAGADGQIALAAGLKPALLPRPPALFVGRRHEMSALERRLDRQRLVTVVGPGGIGKTALCLRFAQAHPPAQAGPWLADLSQVRPGEPVLPLLARLVLDEDGAPGDDAAARFGAVVGPAPALIILDNCEHVLAEAAVAVTRLLDACAGLRILATSREPMHLPDESVMTIGPLPVTGGNPGPGASAPEPGDAVELFMRLLSQARGEQAGLSAQDAAAVTDLCHQLDGIPLCIELAAARARTLPVRDIAASVGRGVAILSGGRRDLPRHQAIEATISWSWDLLAPGEQRALSRLAVLAAPFSFRCGAEMAAEELDSGERMVAALADKSLLSHHVTEAGEARLRVLGVVRNFAVARLSVSDRDSAVRKLMSWALSVTQIDELTLQQPEVIERLDADFPLISAALELSEDTPADQVRLALAIWQYWHMRSSSYGCRFLVKAYDENTPLSPAERGRALGALSNLLGYRGDFAGSIDASKRSVEIRRAIGDPTQLRYGLIGLLGTLLETRRLDDAEHCLAEIDAVAGEIEPSALADLNVARATLYAYRGDPRRAVQLIRAAYQIFTSEKLNLGLVFCLHNLSLVYRATGDFEASLQTAIKAGEMAGHAFGPSFEGEVTVSVAAAYQALGKHEDALAALDAMPLEEYVRPSACVRAVALRATAASAASPSAAAAFLLAHAGEFAAVLSAGVNQSMALVSAVQEIAYQSGAYESAARLLGLHGRLWPDHGEVEVGPPAPGSSSRLSGHLPPSKLAALMAEGTRIEPSQALDFAVTILDELAAPELTSSPEDLFTAR